MGVVNLVVLSCVFRRRPLKKVVNFLGTRSAPTEKFLATPMTLYKHCEYQRNGFKS